MSRRGLPSGPIVGERVELDRYTVSDAERVLYGQRIDGVVRVIDRPARGRGRSYVVERGLERDGYGALRALVADYLTQARLHRSVPMAESAIRHEERMESSWQQPSC